MRLILTLIIKSWLSVPPVVRYAVASLPFIICCIVFFFEWDYMYLIGGAVASLVLFVLGLPSQAEKSGYNF